MKRYAIIDSNNTVHNVILWDEASQWYPPEGMTMVNVEEVLCDIGWKYENEVFSEPTTDIPDTPTE